MKANVYRRYCDVTNEFHTQITLVEVPADNWVKIGETEIELPVYSDAEVEQTYKDRTRGEKEKQIAELQASL